MKTLIKYFTLITAVMMMLGLFGCNKNKQFNIKTYLDKPEDTMLVDYFERTVGTPEEQPYYELVMYTYSNTQVKLEQYTGGGTESEAVKTYLVPSQAAQEAFNAVQSSGMNGWNSRIDTVGLNGKLYVCRFPDGKGGYIRVSSDKMPANGKAAFDTVASAISAYLKDEYMVE